MFIYLAEMSKKPHSCLTTVNACIRVLNPRVYRIFNYTLAAKMFGPGGLYKRKTKTEFKTYKLTWQDSVYDLFLCLVVTFFKT